MKEIELSRGQMALVDDEDFDWLSQWKWSYAPVGYAVRRYEGKIILMHRLIMDAPKGKRVDHINMNGIDNRRINLRICSHRENLLNRGKQRNNTTGYKGVSYCSRIDKWRASIRDDNARDLHLGYFKTPEEAALAYNISALKYHGEFAHLNQVSNVK